MAVRVNSFVNVSIQTRINAMNVGSVIDARLRSIEMHRRSLGVGSLELRLSEEQHGSSQSTAEKTQEDQTEIVERLVSTHE